MDSDAVHRRIQAFLEQNGVEFREAHHGPTRTSEEAAAARGEDLRVGGKAIVLKVDKSFMLFVLSAALKLDSSKVKKKFQAKRLRFANAEELMELTGLVPGSVPPFGAPILELPLYVDSSILDNEKIAFNAGSLTDSMIMSVNDYMKIAAPEVFDFSSPAQL
jgi:prolyl-tRNA editing enzyme YbaK/EbsC (Cys-tRNA(Pro) deacylase)